MIQGKTFTDRLLTLRIHQKKQKKLADKFDRLPCLPMDDTTLTGCKSNNQYELLTPDIKSIAYLRSHIGLED
jgi:hypothetical protein